MVLKDRIIKPSGVKPDEFELQVVQVLKELEANADLKANIKDLHICGAKKVEVGTRKAVILFVPVPQLKLYQRIQPRLVKELEKRFGDQVVIVAQRRIIPKPSRKSGKSKQLRPRSRTLTHVHDSILEDLVYPSEIIGKRLRYKLDGSRLVKVHLEKSQQGNLENKLETLTAVYRKLTGKEVAFEFPLYEEPAKN